MRMETWSWLELYSSGAVNESSQQESIGSGHSHLFSAAAIEELHGQCGVGIFESVLSEVLSLVRIKDRAGRMPSQCFA